MQSSSPPPNLANINQLFNQYDTDQDGKISDEEIENIFHDLGFTDVYIGTIRKVIRLLNIDNPEDKRLNFIQLQEFAEAMITKGRFKVWKLKLGYRQDLKQILRQIYGEQENGASPGAGPGSAPTPTNNKQVNSQEGQILINVGNTNASSQYFNFSLEKQKGQQIKPFIKISVERNTKEEATKIQSLFKEMYNTLIEILKSEQEQLMSEILSVSFITSVNNNVFNLFITTGNQGLVKLVEMFADYFDQVLKSPVNGKIQGSFKFDFDFEKFISDSKYNFYDILVKNSSIHLKWNLWEFFNAFRKLAMVGKAFENLGWDKTDEFSLFLIGFLHCQKFAGKLQFNSTTSQGQQTKSKEEVIKIFKCFSQSLREIGQQTGLGFIQMLSQLDGKVSIQVGVKDWRVNIETKLKNFTKLFTQQIKDVPLSDEQEPSSLNGSQDDYQEQNKIKQAVADMLSTEAVVQGQNENQAGQDSQQSEDSSN